MGLAIMVIILGGSVAAEFFMVLSMIKKTFSSAAKTAVQGAVLKQLEAKTGISPKSLVDQKGFLDNESNNQFDPFRFLTGVGMKTARVPAAGIELAGKSLANAIDKASGNRISSYSTKGIKKVKDFAHVAKEGIQNNKVTRTIKGVANQVDKGKRWVGARKKEFDDLIDSTVVGGTMSRMGDSMIRSALRRKHPDIRFKRPNIDDDPLPVDLRGSKNQIRNLIQNNQNNTDYSRRLRPDEVAQLTNENPAIGDNTKKEYMEGLKLYKDLMGGVKNTKNYAKYKKNAEEFAIAYSSIKDKPYGNLNDPKAEELQIKMLTDIVKNTPRSLDSGNLINQIHKTYDNYSNQSATTALRDARKFAEKENSKTIQEDIEDLLTDPSQNKTYEEAFNKIIADGEAFGDADKYFKDKVNKIANNDKQTMIAYFGESGANELQKELNRRKEERTSNIERTVLQTKSELAKKYMQDGMSYEQAGEYVNELENGTAIDEVAYKQALEATINSSSTRHISSDNGSRVTQNTSDSATSSVAPSQTQAVSEQPAVSVSNAVTENQNTVNVDSSELAYMGYDTTNTDNIATSTPSASTSSASASNTRQSSTQVQKTSQQSSQNIDSELAYMGYNSTVSSSTPVKEEPISVSQEISSKKINSELSNGVQIVHDIKSAQTATKVSKKSTRSSNKQIGVNQPQLTAKQRRKQKAQDERIEKMNKKKIAEAEKQERIKKYKAEQEAKRLGDKFNERLKAKQEQEGSRDIDSNHFDQAV